MLSEPSDATMAAGQGLLVAAGALTFGYLISNLFFGSRPVSRVLPWALALPSLVGYSLVLMVGHMVTGGWVFSHALFVRALTAVVALLLVILNVRTARSRPNGQDRLMLWMAFGVAVVAILLWSYPTLEMLPLHYSPDTRSHMGWAHQLLNGYPTPTAALSGDIPNFYPWLFHVFTAVVALFTPGGNPFHALVPMQFLFVVGVVLGLFALGQEVGRGPVMALSMALFGALTGGFGYVVARGPEIVMSPRSDEVLDFLGDLLQVRSYNFAFSNVVPPYPRDLTFALLPAFLLLLTRGITNRSRPYLVAAGTVLGGMGLAQGGEAFLVAALTTVVVIALTYRDGVFVRMASLVVPALLLFALWAAPLMINYFRHGGFFDMSRSSLDYPLWAAAASWGVILPFGIYGLVRALPESRTSASVRVMTGFLLSATAALAGSALFEVVLGEGFGPVSRRHRYWPILCLAVAIFAAFGASDLFERLRKRRMVALLSAGVVVLLAIPSPLLASLAYPEEAGTPKILKKSLIDRPPTFLDALAGRNGVCTVASPRSMAHIIFAYTGHRAVAIILGPKLKENRARVRWRDIYDVTETLENRLSDTNLLMSGGESVAQWRNLVAKYGVDAVVVQQSDIHMPSFDGHVKARFSTRARPFYVVWVGNCEG
jgi:hypothetical protein